MNLKNRDQKKTVVKKIKPYPISVQIFKTDGTTPMEGQILRLTEIGFQMEVNQLAYRIGEIYKVVFTLPLLGHIITINVKTIKTMDSFKDVKLNLKNYLIEMHFINLSSEQAKYIDQFEIEIKQKVRKK